MTLNGFDYVQSFVGVYELHTVKCIIYCYDVGRQQKSGAAGCNIFAIFWRPRKVRRTVRDHPGSSHGWRILCHVR